MPNLRHAHVVTSVDNPDKEVSTSEWNAPLQYTDATGAPSGTDAAVRELLATERTYYVRTDGSDSNDGLSNTAAGAFRTIQHGIDHIANGIDSGAGSVVLQVGAGTYAENVQFRRPFMGGPSASLTVRGDTTTPSNVVIAPTSGLCVLADVFTSVSLEGFKLTSVDSGGIRTNGGTINVGAMDFGTVLGNHMEAFFPGSLIYLYGSYTISGGADTHYATGCFGTISSFDAITITLTGTPAFATFASADNHGNITIYVNGPQYVGAATGKRYEATLNSVVQTYAGAGTAPNYFPGSIAGTTATGGQYGG